jgi:hypothetical protein
MKLYDKKTKRFYTTHFAELYGREIAKWALSLSVFHRPTRHRYCLESYKDFDLRNCHMRIALAYCKHYNLPHDAVQAYCDNETILRNALMELHFPMTPENDNDEYKKQRKVAAKQLLISMLNGGAYAYWKKTFKIRDNYWHPDVIAIQREVTPLTDMIYAANTKIKEFCIKKNAEWKVETKLSKVQKNPTIIMRRTEIWPQ